MVMGENQTIRVNFARPMPVFPLASVTLMPHAVLPVHIFEPRYRAMVSDALDGAGQIAMAIFAGSRWRDGHEGCPPIRQAVCVGQIVQHDRLTDGRYNIALQGVCRARVVREVPMEGTGKPYRTAMLEAVGVDRDEDEATAATRTRLAAMMGGTTLRELRESPGILKHLADEDVPTSAILELLTFTMLPDPELRYRLLAEGDLMARATLIQSELGKLQRLLERAAPQWADRPPKGLSWN